MQKTLILVVAVLSACSNIAQQKKQTILPGACRIKDYLPLIEGRKVGLCVNHTAVINETHLSDTLIPNTDLKARSATEWPLNIRKVKQPSS